MIDVVDYVLLVLLALDKGAHIGERLARLSYALRKIFGVSVAVAYLWLLLWFFLWSV